MKLFAGLLLVAAVTTTAVEVAPARSLPAASLALRELKFPSPGNQLITGRSVVVRVKAPAAGGTLTARLHQKNVSKAFKKVSSREWRATFTVGKQLTRGVNHVSVEVKLGKSRKAVGTKRLLVARTAKTPVLKASLSGSRGEYATTVKLLKQPDCFRATLNGRSITRQFQRGLRGEQRRQLSPEEGLRFGFNRLEFTSATADGDLTRSTFNFEIGRTRPLASAGRDRRTRVGDSITMSGRHTLKLRRDTKYHWTIARRPAGSKAKLIGATTSRPSLKPDVNGTYRVRLTATGGGKGSGRDVAEITSIPTYPGMGAAVDTAALQPDGSYAITIGKNCIANQQNCKQRTYSYGSSPVQLLLFDRNTMELKQQAHLSGSKQDAADTYTLLALLGSTTTPKPNLVGILAAVPGQSVDPTWADPMLILTGVSTTIGSNGGWSAVGFPVPGFDEGQQFTTGFVNAGESSIAGAVRGEQQGYFQFNPTTLRFQYFVGDYAAYNTSSSSSATGNAMRVAGTDFGAPPLTPGCTGGVQVVVLRSSTLTPATGFAPNSTYSLNCASQGDSISGAALFSTAMLALQSDPNAAANGPIAVFIQTIGATPIDTTNAPEGMFLSSIGSQIEAMGGNAETWYRANRTSGTQYAFAGYTAAISDALPKDQYLARSPDATSLQNGSDGTLVGTLRRNQSWHFAPRSGTPNSTGGGGLTNILYQPTQAWPTGGTKGEASALAYISNLYDIEYSASSSCYKPKTPDVRFEYCDINADWGPLLRGLPNLKWPGQSGCGCSSAEWSAVRKDIPQEISWVKRVYKYVGIMQTVYGGPGNQESLLGLKKIGTAVNNIFNPPPKNVISGFWSEVTANILNGLSIIPESDTASDAVQWLSTLAFLTEDVLVDPNGAGTVSQIVKTTAGDLPSQLEGRYLAESEQLGQLGNMLVADYGKLQAANTSGALQIDEDALDALTGSMMVGAYRFAYGKMLGAGYDSYALPPSQIAPAATSPSNYLCNYGLGSQTPFGGIGESSYVTQAQNTPALPVFGNTNVMWTALGEKGKEPVNNLPSPPESLMAPLFQPVSPNGNGVPQTFGAYKPQWYRSNFVPKLFSCPGNP